ncbi:MAG: hypothetical protein JNK17_14720 [Hydrogenophaga sp.]|nr:hypothetical protein [Hydrogenophaga sp.]
MKSPIARPGTNMFMVFSMLLLGVFASALVVTFDFWIKNDELALSTAVIRKIAERNVPTAWVVAIAGPTAMSIGFFFYLISFFLLAVPAFGLRKFIEKISKNQKIDIFQQVSEKTIKNYLPEGVTVVPGRKFSDAFMYLLLTSRDSHIASAARFSFTQIMFARSIGAIMIGFSSYLCWIQLIPLKSSILIIAATWVSLIALYGVGLTFFERVVISGILIERLHQKTRPQSGSAKQVSSGDKSS